MVHTFTKRNHYNPCFWTAYWNEQYYDANVYADAPNFTARDQQVFTLNVRADKVFPTTVDNVHYDKKLGVAEITPASMLRVCKRWFPSELKDLSNYLENNPENVFIDFEDVLAGIEEKGGYKYLIEAVRTGGISSVQHKGFLTCIFVIHALRSHEMMNSMVDTTKAFGMDKWEYFWILKNALGNPLVLARAATPIAFAQWILYRTSNHRFPLCDSPIMIGHSTVMVCLSPRLLLEINLDVKCPEDIWIERDGISPSKYREFRRRSIQNTFKEIIFHDPEELERWRKLREYKIRGTALRDHASHQELIAEAATRVIWAINGFDRVPPDFEEKMKWLYNA